MAGGDKGGIVRAEIDAILDTAGWMDSVTDDFNSDIEALRRQVETLMEQWRGGAADTHSDTWNDWFSNADNLIGALTDDAKALRAAAKAYHSTDVQTTMNIGDTEYEVNI